MSFDSKKLKKEVEKRLDNGLMFEKLVREFEFTKLWEEYKKLVLDKDGYNEGCKAKFIVNLAATYPVKSETDFKDKHCIKRMVKLHDHLQARPDNGDSLKYLSVPNYTIYDCERVFIKLATLAVIFEKNMGLHINPSEFTYVILQFMDTFYGYGTSEKEDISAAFLKELFIIADDVNTRNVV